MRQSRDNGFVFVMVIVALALVGAVMFVLSDGSKTMIFQSDGAYLRACRRNLSASGLAWVRTHAGKPNAMEVGEAVVLDVNDLGIRAGALSVTVVSATEDLVQVETATKAARRNRTESRELTYSVRLSSMP